MLGFVTFCNWTPELRFLCMVRTQIKSWYLILARPSGSPVLPSVCNTVLTLLRPTFVKSITLQHAHLWTREYVNVCAKESHFVCKLKLQRGIAILPQGNNHPSVSVKGKNVKIVSDQDYWGVQLVTILLLWNIIVYFLPCFIEQVCFVSNWKIML